MDDHSKLGRPLKTVTHEIGEFSIVTNLYVCQCLCSAVYTKLGEFYKEGWSYCNKHGAERDILPGQVEMFGPAPKKKRGKKGGKTDEKHA
jgi:hypothetical protein